MSRQFLTGLNLNKNELLNARIQNLSTPPSSPVTGQIYYDTDTNQINVWDGTAWAALAAGGNVGDQIAAAINALTTDDIEEGLTNLYFTAQRAKDAAAALLTGATKTNITITGNGSGLTITAENGVADSTTDDLTEGSTNLYYTNTRVDNHLTGGNGISYSSGTIDVDLVTGGGLGITTGQLGINRTTVDTWYDASGAASTVAGDLTTHISDTSTHGVTGDIVGTSDTQTLTNKTIGLGGLVFNDGTGSNSSVYVEGNNMTVYGRNNLYLNTYNNDIILQPDGQAKVYNDVIITQNASQFLSNKTIGDTGVYFNDGTTQYGRIYNDGSNNLVINGSHNDVILTSNSGYAYIGTNADATTRIATQAYVDGVAQGLNVKASVSTIATTNIPVGADLGSLTEISGVTLTDGMRVLLVGQSTASQNGIYVYALNTRILSRAVDQPTVDKGDYVLVINGTYAATGWIASSSTVWTQFSAANEYTAGNGIDITGNAVSVKLDSDSLAVSGSGLKVNYHTDGGLGNDSGLYVKTGTGLTIDGSGNVALASGYGVQKYAEQNALLEPTSNVVSWVVNHNIGTRDVTVQVYDLTTYAQVEVDVAHTNTTAVTLNWVATANVAADKYRVVVIG